MHGCTVHGRMIKSCDYCLWTVAVTTQVPLKTQMQNSKRVSKPHLCYQLIICILMLLHCLLPGSRRLTPKGQALPCLEMQWQWQTQLLEFSCKRLRKLTRYFYHTPFTLGSWNFEIFWKIRLSPLKDPKSKIKIILD